MELSPESISPTTSSSGNADLSQVQVSGTINVDDGDIPKSHLDFLNLIFPPTPEKSPDNEDPAEVVKVIVEPANPEIRSEQYCLFMEDQNVALSTSSADSITEIGSFDDKIVCSSGISYTVPDKSHVDNLSSITATVYYYQGPVYDTDNICTNSSEASQHFESPDSTKIDALSPDSLKDDTSRSTKKPKRLTKALTFPPCYICGGNASGSHYGVNSCEACKGFFRRYTQKKEVYKCVKDGNCVITSRHRGNCSGCRLQKCLALGMSKEKSKMGRYTLSKRTEAIKVMNQMAGKEKNDSVVEKSVEQSSPDEPNPNTSDYNLESEMIGRKITQNTQNLNVSNGFSAALVAELVQAMDEIMPYGPGVTNDEQLQEQLIFHAERYQRKIELYGQMNAIPKDEYYKLYTQFGIDIDGRMDELKDSCRYVEDVVEKYCNFAKHIPGFYKLAYIDQSNLLKSCRADFFFIIAHKAYSKDLKTFVCNTGKGYHVDEVTDKFFSSKLMSVLEDIYVRWQALALTKEETAVIAALTLTFTDRCKLECYTEVEKMQFALTDLLRAELEKKGKDVAKRRFTKIIDLLTLMRDGSELYLKEYNQLCKDEVLVEEVPMLTEFLLEEADGTDK